MVYVDTGSKDNSSQVAKDGGCKVYEVGDRFRTVVDEETAKKINEKFVYGNEPNVISGGDSFFSFSAARNYAMSLATNDFVCTPDSDEAWTTLDIDKLNELIEAGWEKFTVDFVYAHNEDGTPSVAFANDGRFVDRRKVKWVGIIHETQSGETKMMHLPRDVAYLEHWQNHETDRSKYMSGLSWSCYVEPNNDRHSHYFARELLYKGYYRSAIKEFEHHISLNQWADERGQSMVYMGDCYGYLGDNDKAIECWNKAYVISGNRREPFIRLAKYWRRMDSPIRVAAYTAAAMQIPNSGFYANEVANYTDGPYALMYWAKGWMGNIPEARENLLKCLEYHPTNETYLHDMQYYFSPVERELAIRSAGLEYPYINDIEGWMTQKELGVLYSLARNAGGVIEIGSWKGRSTKAILDGCKGTVTAIDHFQGSPGEGTAHDEAKGGDIYSQFMKNVGHFINLKVIKMASLDAARQNGLSADVVFIDGSHQYEDVVEDIKAWLPHAKKIICGHDYTTWPGVKKAVDETLGPVEVRESIWIKQL